MLRRAWREPFTLQCDFARRYAGHVAMAASKGFITTRIEGAVYGRIWRITAVGLKTINESEI